MSDCFKKNELLIGGTRQDERLSKALQPDYVLPDERSIADLMVFITKYAELINYYTIKGENQKDYEIDGNWKSLILSDEAFNYAGIAITPYTLPNVTFYKYVNLYETGSTSALRNEKYRVLWDVLFSVYKDIDQFYTSLPVYMPLRNVIATEINNGLVTDFGLAAGAYLNAAGFITPLNLQIPTVSTDEEYKFKFADTLIKDGFDKVWIDTILAPAANSWNDYLAQLNPNLSLAQTFFNTFQLTDPIDRIDYSTIQLKQIFKRAFESYARIIVLANDYLRNNLDNNSSHYAHHGLMLAFLKLFGILQTDINDFTRKHLEYYYNRVLNLTPAAPVPDAAHIVFEPAKNITTHLIKKDTSLNGGKDGLGKLLLYNTDNEIVINQAKIAGLKTVFIEPDTVLNNVKRVYASPVANSKDGMGAAFTTDDISWKGFGDIRVSETDPSAAINIAPLGFYIASPILHLTEGRRQIDITFQTNLKGIEQAIKTPSNELNQFFNFFISGEKGWEPLIVDVPAHGETGLNGYFGFAKTIGPPYHYFKITLILLPNCPALVGYNKDVCDGDLTTIYPVIKFSLNQNKTSAYENFKNIAINKITIDTSVNEIANVSLQNDLGALDAAKPVQPFGPIPQKGSAFYIGHPELEHKLIQSFSVSLDWLNLNLLLGDYYKYTYTEITGSTPTYHVQEPYVSGIVDNTSFKVVADIIRNKKWVPSTGAENSLFTPFGIGFPSPLEKSFTKTLDYQKSLIALTPFIQNGFIRITLSNPADTFGHSLWAKLFAQQTVAVTKDADTAHNTIPNPPYTPVLKSVKLNYTATQDINLNINYKPDQGQFFQLTPFGVKETNANVFLLPTFQVQRKEPNGSFVNKPIEAAVFIGISNAVINENISLLLQLDEGTEDISIDSPKIIWNYLSANGWRNFDKALLADTTENLLKSGIITFQVPVDIDLQTTEFTTGNAWIAASIEPSENAGEIKSNALPKILEVFTNAVKATFDDVNNDPEHLAAALPGKTISKLYESDAAVKKIIQPYASFGGKKTEEGNRFYTRVSERLRHKHRAITIWDYERLVLNEFPEVYMIKCLNHTGYDKNCTTGISNYKENVPGQVMLVAVPYVTNLQAGNIFQPTFSAAKLTDIKNFIHGADNAGTCNKYVKALHCQMASLYVKNPTYETVKVKCNIKVKDCLDKLFYKYQLVEDLKKFLSPWITGDEGKINFGGKLHVSQVIYFIEQLSYIDYLEFLTFEHKDAAGILLNIADPSMAVAVTSMSVLTSFTTHDINFVS